MRYVKYYITSKDIEELLKKKYENHFEKIKDVKFAHSFIPSDGSLLEFSCFVESSHGFVGREDRSYLVGNHLELKGES